MCRPLPAALRLALAAIISGAALTAFPLLAEGELDPSFSGDGWYSFDNATWDHEALDLAVDAQGRILVSFLIEADIGGGLTEPRAALLRLLPTGAVDNSFGLFGLWFDSLTPALASSRVPVAVGPNGNIVVGFDIAANGSNTDWMFRLLGNDGSVLRSRIVDFNLGSGQHRDSVSDLLVLADNRVVAVGGAEYNGDDWDFAIAMLTADTFQQDPTFSGDGLTSVNFDLGAGNLRFDSAMAVVSDGARLVVAGWANSDTGWQYAVTQLLIAGVLDPTFNALGTPGRVHDAYSTLGWLSAANYANGVALDASGRVFVGGEVLTPQFGGGAQQDVGVLCLEADGLRCSRFGDSNGWATVDTTYPGMLGSWNNSASAIGVDEQQRVLLAGVVVGPTLGERQATAHRLRPDGEIDDTFGLHGTSILTFAPTAAVPRDRYNALAITPGRLLVAGRTMVHDGSGLPRGDYDPLVARLSNGGSLLSDGFESGSAVLWSWGQP